MQVGMNLPVMVPGLDRDALLEWCRRIDAGPWSHVAAGERITFPNPEILVTLSAAAIATERVDVFPHVIVLPMHDARLVAKQLATLDVVSGGRLRVGLGAGAREEDFRAIGAPFGARRVSQLAEQADVLRRTWAGALPFEGAGRPIEPAPTRAGGPPLYAGSILPRAIERAAAWADGLCGFSFGPDLDAIEQTFETARRAWNAADRPAPRLITSFFYALGPEPDDQMARFVHRYLAFMGDAVARQVAPQVTARSPARLAELLRGLRDLGADEVSLVATSLDPDEVDRAADVVASIGGSADVQDPGAIARPVG
jgi:alkanesulfonate monooxygenase SsuD/methylene tetrahydromethanopterin reductase-like flavin-dependent oxidoreductase (luciferase family)